MHDTRPLLQQLHFPSLTRQSLRVLQVNLGYVCNLSCVHCHVNAGPKRTESMTLATLEQVLQFAQTAQIQTLDLTGGAPEMHPHFRYAVSRARDLGMQVIDRCNLSILQEPDYSDLAAFLAQQQVEIVASLPCYLQDNVDKQRGKGVFKQSIAALQRLNQLGYAQPNSDLKLNLVFNPQDAVLPPEQQPLEQAYKQHLHTEFGIQFDHLFVMVNMPIQRFGSTLVSQGRFDAYLHLLRTNFCAENLKHLMCLNTLSIDWRGYVYDCDFNQMLDMPLGNAEHPRLHISNLSRDSLLHHPIATADHCFGCTAGQGSSCGGALSPT